MPASSSVGDALPILTTLIGRIVAYGPEGEPSAYVKHPVTGALTITATGIDGDQQADLAVHGGTDKAMLHYPHEHYATFAAERPDLAPVFAGHAAFGENISTEGWTEWDVCLGDRFELGTALVEICQGRSPCWKLGHRFRDQSMVEAVVKTRRGGWYYRVLEAGSVSQGDEIHLIARPHPDWPVARAFGLLVGKDRDTAALSELVEMPCLAGSWRSTAAARLASAMNLAADRPI